MMCDVRSSNLALALIYIFSLYRKRRNRKFHLEKMSESDDDLSVSENNWPMNEAWLIGILKGDDQTGGKVKINVNFYRAFNHA